MLNLFKVVSLIVVNIMQYFRLCLSFTLAFNLDLTEHLTTRLSLRALTVFFFFFRFLPASLASPMISVDFLCTTTKVFSWLSASDFKTKGLL